MENLDYRAVKKPLRVCHIIATTEGATWAFEQLRDLRDRYGYEVAAILNGDKGGLVDRFNAEKIPVYSADFDFTSSAELLLLPKKVLNLIRILNRERFDVIQTHLFHSMVIGRISAWFADVPLRFSMIAGPFHLEADTPRWIDKYTFRLDTSVIASCDFTRSLYLQMGASEDRIETIYYGPDERKFDPALTSPADLRSEFGWSEDTQIIGLIAYFYPELPSNRWIAEPAKGSSVKRQEDLIRAAPLILEEFPQAKILFIGSGWEQGGEEYLEKMKSLANELGLGGSIKFSGYRTDIASTLLALDVAVQCAVSENLGGTIESLLMECPTVATRVGGMTDSVVDGITGVLVNPVDPESLALGIMKLLRNPELARQYGATGRKRMLSNFTLHHTVDQLAFLYQRKSTVAARGYRPHMVAIRFLIGGVLCLFIATRYALLDAYILPRWDSGWRPWRKSALSIIPFYHRFLSFVGRILSALAIRTRLRVLYHRFLSFVGRVR